MSRVGIERLPARRASTEPRESMNCKSCRKRKIKCNRVKPTCEACSLFQAPCIYDAVPKKRGPKTDVLEALLKRVDGLEKRLQDEGKSTSPVAESSESAPSGRNDHVSYSQSSAGLETPIQASFGGPPNLPQDLLFDLYFTRMHGKPYYILDETSTRRLQQAGQLSHPLLIAMYAGSIRYAPNVEGSNLVRSVLDYAERARMAVDVDEPSIQSLQTLLLLCAAFFSAGKGKKVQMLLSIAIGMAMALELHREVPLEADIPPFERETRRRLFWTCYLMDRFMPCGSKRPSLIPDKSILLRMPSPTSPSASQHAEGDFFWDSSNIQQMSGHNSRCRGSAGNLIEIAQILGSTNQYLAAGGVKGDSHFPWHSLSNVSKLRQRLDMWASTAQEIFSWTPGTVADRSDNTTVLLSRLIYHAVHCLIYRPFIPIDLAELSRGGQHQSWQIEATKLCFSHANAIGDLVEPAANAPGMEWSSLAGYCVCTAGTVHIHGAHYRGKEAEPFASSGNYLAIETQQLSRISSIWAGIRHLEELLQRLYGLHSDLVRSLASSPIQNAPIFNLEDFFDRYPGQYLDGSFVTFRDADAQSKFESDAPFNVPRKPSISKVDPDRRTNGSLQSTAPYYPTSGRSEMLPSITPARHRTSSVQESYPAPGPSQRALPSPTMGSPGMMHMNRPNGNLFPTQDPSYSYSQRPQIPDSSPYSPQQPFIMPSFPTGGMAPNAHSYNLDQPHHQQPVMTPSAHSQTGSLDAEHDPFLSLLEQLADNEHSRGGPSELDFFLSAQGQ